MIYVIKSTDYIKVGYSQDEETLERRINSYNTHNPEYIILNVYEGSKNNEHDLHVLLSEYKYKNEWFLYNGNVLTTIQKYIKSKKLKAFDLGNINKYFYTLTFSLNNKINITIEKIKAAELIKEFEDNNISCLKIDWKEYDENPNNYKFKREDKCENKMLENDIKSVLLNKEYTFSELKDLFIPIFKIYNLSFNSSMLKLYFPEFTKCRKTREGKKDTYYKFNI